MFIEFVGYVVYCFIWSVVEYYDFDEVVESVYLFEYDFLIDIGLEWYGYLIDGEIIY